MLTGFGLGRLGLFQRPSGGAFSPLSLSPSPIAWYDPSDLTTLFQDSAGTTPVTADGDVVGLMQDKSGNSFHLTQATTANKPLYKTAGGLHWLQGDGVDDYLQGAFALTQPWERISGIQQVTWTGLDTIFGGANIARGMLRQSGASPQIVIANGLNVTMSPSLALGTSGVVTEKFDDANSRVALNNNNYVTGDTGDAIGPGGLTLFATNTPSSYANARCFGIIIVAGGMADGQITSARTWMAAKSGVTL